MCKKDSRVVIVTGAARGIGMQIARKFSENGDEVIALDIDEEKLEKTTSELGANVSWYGCDVSKENEVGKIFKRVGENRGRLDVLVNNAGILMRGFIEDFTSEELRTILDVNLFGVYNCCRSAVKIMKAQNSGVILNASSIVTKQFDVGLVGYCLSKKGVEVLTKILAGEVARYGIRVNAYAPGTSKTPMTKSLIDSRGEEKVKQIPHGRFGTPQDIAEACFFLASKSASHITGTVMEIDGGELIVQHPEKRPKNKEDS